jgi:hypothetical protein
MIGSVVVGLAVSQDTASRAWSIAGHHAAREVERLRATDCDPAVVSRGPVQRNTMAFLDTSNAAGAAAVACRRSVAVAVRVE